MSNDLIIPGLGPVPQNDIPSEIKKIIYSVQEARGKSKKHILKVFEKLIREGWKIQLNFNMPPTRCVVHSVTNYYSDLHGFHQNKELLMKVGRLYKGAYDEMVMKHGTLEQKKRIASL